jgi:hypothetical protein
MYQWCSNIQAFLCYVSIVLFYVFSFCIICVTGALFSIKIYILSFLCFTGVDLSIYVFNYCIIQYCYLCLYNCILCFSCVVMPIQILYFKFHWYVFVHYDFVFYISLVCIYPSRFCILCFTAMCLFIQMLYFIFLANAAQMSNLRYTSKLNVRLHFSYPSK